MKCTVVPLQDLSVLSSAIMLWNKNEFKALAAKFHFQSSDHSEREKEFQVLEDEAVRKMRKLLLPELLKKKVLKILKSVFLEVLIWKEKHAKILSHRLKKSVYKICLTSKGTVDQKKTAETLVKDGSLYYTTRYKLACIYCLENDILTLWHQMHKSRRKYFYSKRGPGDVNQHELVVFWTYAMYGELTWLRKKMFVPCLCRSIYQRIFEKAALEGNKVVTEYFLQKLTPQEKDISLMYCVQCLAFRRGLFGRTKWTDLSKRYQSEVVYFLLSEMSDEQQVKVYTKSSYGIASCLLDLPWQHFIEKLDFLWGNLSLQDYNKLLLKIIDLAAYGYMDCNYQKCLGEFWKQSPDVYKEYVINTEIKNQGECEDLLSCLLNLNDRDNIKLILNDATITEKENFIFSDKGKCICVDLIYTDKSDLLKFFVRECIFSRDVMIKFKKELEKHVLLSSEMLRRETDLQQKSFEVLDDCVSEYHEWKHEEENIHSAVRFHSSSAYRGVPLRQTYSPGDLDFLCVIT
ncbi:hypothetical protein X975_00253, partial [Stegodyphus mimosarum]